MICIEKRKLQKRLNFTTKTFKFTYNGEEEGGKNRKNQGKSSTFTCSANNLRYCNIWSEPTKPCVVCIYISNCICRFGMFFNFCCCCFFWNIFKMMIHWAWIVRILEWKVCSKNKKTTVLLKISMFMHKSTKPLNFFF